MPLGDRIMVLRSILILPILLSFSSPAWPSFPEAKLTARAAFLMDAATGQVLYAREPDLPLPPASTTKIVSAIVALESEKKEKDLFRVSKTATQVPSSKLYLRPGQAMTMEDLLYSLLLSSANDASLVLAQGIAGSVQRFAEMMTLKARAIGATNTRFTNPHGLTAPGHYSTARDMALLFNYAMQSAKFREIVQTKTASVSSITTGKTKRARPIFIRNHNRLLWNFEGTIGGKTGYTYAAQRCFVGGVSRDGTTLIVSILGSRDLWGDITRLLDYGLEESESLKLASSGPVRPHSVETPSMRQESYASPLLTAEGDKELPPFGGYVLQIASFREHDRAESVRQWLIEGGFDAYTESASLNNGDTTYRVRIGPYDQLTEAQEVALEIENKSSFKTIIVPATPVVRSSETVNDPAQEIRPQ